MDSEGSALITALDRLNRVVKSDPDLTVKGLGILLLHKRFDRETEDDNKDPTFAILGGKVGGLGNDEMIPKL